MSKVSKEARVERGEKEVMEKGGISKGDREGTSRGAEGGPGDAILEPKEENVTRRRE